MPLLWQGLPSLPVGELHKVLQEHDFSKDTVGNSQAGHEAWYSEKGSILLCGDGWEFRSWHQETMERIQRAHGHLSRKAASAVRMTKQGVAGESAAALSAMLETFKWLESKEVKEANETKEVVVAENEPASKIPHSIAGVVVVLLIAFAMVAHFRRDIANVANASNKPISLPDTSLPLSAARKDNVADEYAMIVAQYGNPNSVLSTVMDSPPPKVATKIARYMPAHTGIIFAPNGCVSAYEKALAILEEVSEHPSLAPTENQKLQRCVSPDPGWTIVGYIDTTDNQSMSAELAERFLSKISDKRMADR